MKTPDHLETGTRRLRLGIVGGGLVSHWHNSGIRLSNRWDMIAGAFSSDPEKAARQGREWLLDEERVYASYESMAVHESARDDGIEAVAICTPNHTHRVIADVFMRNGIDVICDKPIANTREDGEHLVKLQKESGLVFAVTHPYTYHPMVRQARQMIAQGAIGAIRQYTIEYAQEWAGDPADESDNPAGDQPWRKDPARAGRTSTTGDIGTHAFHMLEYVCGQTVKKLRADFHVCGPARELEDTAFLNLRLEQGAPGMMWLTQVAAGQHCGLRFGIYGDTGSISWDQEVPESIRYSRFNQPDQIILRGQGGGMLSDAESMTKLPRGHGESLSDAWASLYTDIARAVEARRSGAVAGQGFDHLPDVVDGLRGIQFVDVAADSHAAGGVWMDCN